MRRFLNLHPGHSFFLRKARRHLPRARRFRGWARKTGKRVGGNGLVMPGKHACCFPPEYGGRPVKRYVQREVETEIARMVLSGQVLEGGKVRVDAEGGRLRLEAES